MRLNAIEKKQVISEAALQRALPCAERRGVYLSSEAHAKGRVKVERAAVGIGAIEHGGLTECVRRSP